MYTSYSITKCHVVLNPSPCAISNNFASLDIIGYKKNKMSTDMESGRGNKRARVTRGLCVAKYLVKKFIRIKSSGGHQAKRGKNLSPRKRNFPIMMSIL
jgi:hypothetical protein